MLMLGRAQGPKKKRYISLDSLESHACLGVRPLFHSLFLCLTPRHAIPPLRHIEHGFLIFFLSFRVRGGVERIGLAASVYISFSSFSIFLSLSSLGANRRKRSVCPAQEKRESERKENEEKDRHQAGNNRSSEGVTRLFRENLFLDYSSFCLLGE